MVFFSLEERVAEIEKLLEKLDTQAMEYGEMWHKVKYEGHSPRLDVVEKEVELLKTAQELYLARKKVKNA